MSHRDILGGPAPARGRRTAPAVLISTVLALGLTMTFTGIASAHLDVGCRPPPASLVSWWTGDGDATDSAGNRDGALIGGTGFAPGIVDQAFSLDGIDDLVRVPDARAWTLGRHAFTIDAWVNFASLPERGAAIVSHDEGTGPIGGGEVAKWIFWFDNLGHEGLPGNALRFHINSPTLGPNIDTIAAFWTPTLNHWHHVALTRYGNTYRLFIDGVKVAKDWDAHKIPNADAPLEIGAAEGGHHFAGLIDEVDIFDAALTHRQIKKIVLAGPSGKCK